MTVGLDDVTISDDIDTDAGGGADVKDKITKSAEPPKMTKDEWQAVFEKDVLPKRLSRKEAEVYKSLGIKGPDDYATIAEKAKNFDVSQEAQKTEDEKRAERDAQRDREFDELRNNLKERDRKLLINEVADELEIPKKLRQYLTGDDEDSLRESATSLLDAVSEFGGSKKKNDAKVVDDSVKEKKTVYGGGDKKPSQVVDPKELVKKIMASETGLLT
jgi:hypothetical protein